jgi:hypothetical protein
MTSSDYVIVNGSRIERRFFEENLEEARGLDWRSVDSAIITEHKHCLICMKALPDDRDRDVFVSDNRWLCSFCHSTFLEEE